MPAFSLSYARARLRTVILSALMGLTLSACGGGGDSASSGSGGNAPQGGADGTAPPIDALLGDWVQKGCVATGGQSFKKILRASRTAANTIDYFEGVRTYGGIDCTGPSLVAGPSKLGSVSFSRSAADQSLAAHWGQFLTVTNTRFGAIWALKSSNVLCLLGDEIPTIQPSLASVSASLATVPESNCFTR